MEINKANLKTREQVVAVLFGRMDQAAGYRKQKRYQETAAVDAETLSFCVRMLGPEDVQTLNMRHWLAADYHHLGDHQKAAELDKENLMIRERVWGPEHPDTLDSLNNLVIDYINLGQPREAALLEVSRKLPIHDAIYYAGSKTFLYNAECAFTGQQLVIRDNRGKTLQIVLRDVTAIKPYCRFWSKSVDVDIQGGRSILRILCKNKDEVIRVTSWMDQALVAQSS